MQEEPESIERIKSVFDELSSRFDSFAEMLQGRVYGYVTWEHLKKYLPEDENSLILDAGGGTGKWALPLAKRGYRVILCDISKGMLEQAEKKIIKENLSDRVKIQEENLTNLSFPHEMFDFVLCEDGPISISDSQKVLSELRRVLKKEGKIWASVIGRYPLALTEAEKDPEQAYKLCKRELHYLPYKGIERARVFSPDELQNLFERNGIEVIKLYGNRILMRSLPEQIQAMTDFDERLFSDLAEMELALSEEPSVLGMAEYLQITGEK
ncbi:MAG: methyltransferase domain-containing protein [Deltaproteobacteria bacterium]|nr:methyltransferase domain-containing protein [Deltaproteobacteria bacterium]